jgi:hypothetical protein
MYPKEGSVWNYKRVRRIYRLRRLNKRSNTRKRIPKKLKQSLLQPQKMNQMWSIDFMHHTLETNGYIERFNRTYRQDILDAYIFEGLSQVRILTEEWI